MANGSPTVRDKETGEVKPGKLEKTEIPVPELKEGDVLVEIAGCEVCHTDLGYFYDGIPTVSKPPLTLGHEISGTVVGGDESWIGKEVIIPAVMPCRKCYLCKTGRRSRCLNRKMPGNSMGIYGGFSSHIPVPSIDLCEIKNREISLCLICLWLLMLPPLPIMHGSVGSVKIPMVLFDNTSRKE